MTEQADRNRATVLRLMEALNVCDAYTIRSIMRPDADWWVLGMGTLDRDTMIAQLEQLLGSAKVAETHILGTTAEDDRVAVESRGNFEFADGRVYRNSYHHLFTLHDGQVVGVREYLDLMHFQSVFGV